MSQTIQLSGGAPWGFRLQGGSGSPLNIAKLRQRGKAQQSGLEEGDIVTHINGKDVGTKSLQEVMALMETEQADSLTLVVAKGQYSDPNTTTSSISQSTWQPPSQPQPSSVPAPAVWQPSTTITQAPPPQTSVPAWQSNLPTTTASTWQPSESKPVSTVASSGPTTVVWKPPSSSHTSSAFQPSTQATQPWQPKGGLFQEGTVAHDIMKDDPNSPMNKPGWKPGDHIPGFKTNVVREATEEEIASYPKMPQHLMEAARLQAEEEEAMIRKRKIFSDSAFYDDPTGLYPTIHEQVALCKEIASSLESNQNERARGFQLYLKRKKRARKYTWESGPEEQQYAAQYGYEGGMGGEGDSAESAEEDAMDDSMPGMPDARWGVPMKIKQSAPKKITTYVPPPQQQLNQHKPSSLGNQSTPSSSRGSMQNVPSEQGSVEQMVPGSQLDTTMKVADQQQPPHRRENQFMRTYQEVPPSSMNGPIPPWQQYGSDNVYNHNGTTAHPTHNPYGNPHSGNPHGNPHDNPHGNPHDAHNTHGAHNPTGNPAPVQTQPQQSTTFSNGYPQMDQTSAPASNTSASANQESTDAAATSGGSQLFSYQRPSQFKVRPVRFRPGQTSQSQPVAPLPPLPSLNQPLPTDPLILNQSVIDSTFPHHDATMTDPNQTAAADQTDDPEMEMEGPSQRLRPRLHEIDPYTISDQYKTLYRRQRDSESPESWHGRSHQTKVDYYDYEPRKPQIATYAYAPKRHHTMTAGEIEQLRLTTDRCYHNQIDPTLAFNIAHDLKSTHGKAAQQFAKRRERAEKYVIDEKNVRDVMPYYWQFKPKLEEATFWAAQTEDPKRRPVYRPQQSPWEAAMEGDVAQAFTHLGVYDTMKQNAMKPIRPVEPQVELNQLNYMADSPSKSGYGASIMGLTQQASATPQQWSLGARTWKPVAAPTFTPQATSSAGSGGAPKPGNMYTDL